MSDTPENQDLLAAPIDICIQNQTEVSGQNQKDEGNIRNIHCLAPYFQVGEAE